MTTEVEQIEKEIAANSKKLTRARQRIEDLRESGEKLRHNLARAKAKLLVGKDVVINPNLHGRDYLDLYGRPGKCEKVARKYVYVRWPETRWRLRFDSIVEATEENVAASARARESVEYVWGRLAGNGVN